MDDGSKTGFLANPSVRADPNAKPQAAVTNLTRPTLLAPIILGEISLASPEIQTTVGSAGAASALPATPSGYLKVSMNDAEYVIPFYAQS